MTRSDNPLMVLLIHKFVGRDRAKTNCGPVIINDHPHLFYGRLIKKSVINKSERKRALSNAAAHGIICSFLLKKKIDKLICHRGKNVLVYFETKLLKVKFNTLAIKSSSYRLIELHSNYSIKIPNA